MSYVAFPIFAGPYNGTVEPYTLSNIPPIPQGGVAAFPLRAPVTNDLTHDSMTGSFTVATAKTEVQAYPNISCDRDLAEHTSNIGYASNDSSYTNYDTCGNSTTDISEQPIISEIVTESHEETAMSHDVTVMSHDVTVMSHEAKAMSPDVTIMSHDITDMSPDITAMSHDIPVMSYNIPVMSHDIPVVPHDKPLNVGGCDALLGGIVGKVPSQFKPQSLDGVFERYYGQAKHRLRNYSLKHRDYNCNIVYDEVATVHSLKHEASMLSFRPIRSSTPKVTPIHSSRSVVPFMNANSNYDSNANGYLEMLRALMGMFANIRKANIVISHTVTPPLSPIRETSTSFMPM